MSIFYVILDHWLSISGAHDKEKDRWNYVKLHEITWPIISGAWPSQNMLVKLVIIPRIKMENKEWLKVANQFLFETKIIFWGKYPQFSDGQKTFETGQVSAKASINTTSPACSTSRCGDSGRTASSWAFQTYPCDESRRRFVQKKVGATANHLDIQPSTTLLRCTCQ